MRALVVGAGVVGQVYGRHLAEGGADVTFLVKPEHVEETRRELTLYPLNRPGGERARPVRFSGHRVVAGLDEVRRGRWDQVYLAMSSTALRAGTWFADFVDAIGGATLVLLQPGLEDRAFVLRYLPEERVVQGIITLIGYRAPLPGETRFPEPGVAYWFPPLAPSPLDGPPGRAGEVVEALRRGGLPARQAAGIVDRAPYGAALLIPMLIALERAGWSFARLRRSPDLALGLADVRAALQGVARGRGERTPILLRLAARPLVVRAALRLAPLLAPLLVPFPLEPYLRVHFTKVRDQTLDMMGDLAPPPASPRR